jgi:ubiquinone/menaquinone biosynthesis C-methylase UbiE
MSGELLDPKFLVSQLDIRNGMRIADFGAGAGHFTLLFAKRVGDEGKVSAIDIQEPPLDIIRAKAKMENVATIDAIRANLEVPGGCGLSDASQDMVFVANVLFQSQKKREILQEAKRVLKSGGELVVVEWEKDKGGAGAVNESRMDGPSVQKLVQGEGFTFHRQLSAGTFHYAFIFKK